jgi:hypothetical protein
MKITAKCLMLASIGIIMAGCASKDPGVSRYGAYCEMLNPLVAKANREQVLRRFGMPSKKERVGNVEVWQYLKNYGQQAVAASNASGSEATAVSLGIYDDVTIIFDEKGTLESWRADIR